MATISVPMGQQEGEAPQESGFPWHELLTWTVDHKIIGMQYAITALIFFVIGGGLAMLIRWELMTPAT